MANPKKASKSKRARKVALPELVDPQFLSLVDSPSNMTSFKIVRSEDEVAPLTSKRVRMKRSDDNPLLAIMLPESFTEEDAVDIMIRFGLSNDDYEIVDRGNRKSIIYKKKRNEDIESVNIDLGEGIVAVVERSHLRSGKAGKGSDLSVTELQFFEPNFMDEDSVRIYLKENGISYDTVEQVEAGFIVSRASSGEDVKKVNVGDGVVALVALSDSRDVPKSISRAVDVSALGNYGFGHISFETAVADIHFSQVIPEAIALLNDVLYNIMFLSDMPMADRRRMVSQALSEFSAFVENVLTSLTPEMAEQARSTANLVNHREESTNMITAENVEKAKAVAAEESKPEEVTRSEATEEPKEEQATETVEARSDEAAPVEEPKDEQKEEQQVAPSVSAEDIAAIVRATVESVLAEKEKQKEESIKKEEPAKVEEAVRADDSPKVQAALDAIEKVAQSVDSLANKVKDLSSTTVSRSDSDDPSSGEGQGSVFKGVLGFTRSAG